MADKYEHVRGLPFQTLCAALGIDISRYKTRKGGDEHYGPCPAHNPKQNATSFSYHRSGKFQCFSCGIKGRGGIDLTKGGQELRFRRSSSPPCVQTYTRAPNAPLRGSHERTDSL